MPDPDPRTAPWSAADDLTERVDEGWLDCFSISYARFEQDPIPPVIVTADPTVIFGEDQ